MMWLGAQVMRRRCVTTVVSGRDFARAAIIAGIGQRSVATAPAAGGVVELRDAWEDIVEDDDNSLDTTERVTERLLDQLVRDAEGGDALADAAPTAKSNSFASTSPKAASRRRIHLVPVTEVTAAHRSPALAAQSDVCSAIARDLSSVLERAGAPREGMPIRAAWDALGEVSKVAIRGAGCGLLRWLRATQLFDVSGDDLRVAPLGAMPDRLRARVVGFEPREPGNGYAQTIADVADAWFVDLDLDAPMQVPTAAELAAEATADEGDLDSAAVRRSVAEVAAARKSFAGERIPPPPPPRQATSINTIFPLGDRRTTSGPTPVAKAMPIADVAKLLHSPPPPPPPPGLGTRGAPGGRGTPPPLPRGFAAPPSVLVGGSAAAVPWRSPAEMLNLFVEIVPTFFVAMHFLRPSRDLEEAMRASRLSLPRLLKKYQFYFEVRRPVTSTGVAVEFGGLPDIRLAAAVSHPRRGAPDELYEWARRLEDGSIAGAVPPAPRPTSTAERAPALGISTIESIAASARPNAVDQAPPSAASRRTGLGDAEWALLNAMTVAMQSAPANSVGVTAVDIVERGGFVGNSAAVVATAKARPDVFLFLCPNGVAPEEGGLHDGIPIATRPFTVAPGATGAFGINNSPTPKVVAALGKIVPRGLWVPVEKVISRLDEGARVELASCGISLDGIARAHGRLLYVNDEGTMLRKFAADEQADDVRHFALDLIKDIVAPKESKEVGDVVFAEVLQRLPPPVAVSIALDGATAVRSTLARCTKDFVIVPSVAAQPDGATATPFAEFAVGRASLFRRAAP